MGGARGEDDVVRLPPLALIPMLVRNEGGDSAVFLMRPNRRNLLQVR